MKKTVIVRGAGDVATGIIHKLYNSGFNVLALEIEKPTAIRRTVSFSEAVFNKETVVEGVKAILCRDKKQVEEAFNKGVAVVVDPEMSFLNEIEAIALIDATIAKKNMGININLAEIVIGVGPGFTAKENVHAVIETMRGHNLGRIYYEGKAKDNTGVPGSVLGYTEQRVIKAPCDGVLKAKVNIKDICKNEDLVAMIGETPIFSEMDGIIRGIIRNDTFVRAGMKIGDIDPRIDEVENCDTISDKARCIAGGVLEAIMHLRSELNE